MTGKSTIPTPGFWDWVRAALAFRPFDNHVLREGDLPPLFRVNDNQALARENETFRATRTQLTMLLLATASAMLAERSDSRVPAAMAALLFGLTIAVGMHTSRRQAGAAGYIHRVAAETLKSMAWLYMVGGGPFRTGVADPDALFVERLEGSFRDLRKMGWQDSRSTYTALGSDQITPAMRAVRAKPFAVRREIYLRDRLLEQANWYKKSSARAHRSSVRWSVMTVGLILLAMVAAGLQAMGLSDSWNLTGLLSAAVAAAMAWQEARRYKPRAYAHSLIAQELEMLRVIVTTTVTEEDWADAVAEVEWLVSPQRADLLMRVGA